MTAKILDGKALAKEFEITLRTRVENIIQSTGKVPVLATILVGDDPASHTYVQMKANACKRVGMESMRLLLPATTSTQELMQKISELNANPNVHGILLQHPVPAHIDERLCFDAICVSKDVDGVTTQGFGLMAMGSPAYGSATPAGIMTLLRNSCVELAGRHAVVVGRSAILGKPMAAMLLNADCTVTVCHSKTQGLADIVRGADLVVGAVGKPEFIKCAWIKPGAVVVDAGYHPGGVGDIEQAGLAEIAGAYTPVPGGVGPMTISTLIRQTVESAESAH
jgi:methylenetetrahydrofolate dehydrogenase (NADP+)/methenyltetrahydrofolate cyclohydrolase